MSERDGFLARWSRRKHDAVAGRAPEELPPARAVEPAATAPVPQDVQPPAPPPLPPVESLTIESDFTPFMAKEVDPELKRSALKALFRDERFNVMDGLDVYIDDYSKPAPIPPEWYERMTQLAGLGDVHAREAAAAQADAMTQGSASTDAQLAAPSPAASESAPPIAQPDDPEDGPDDAAPGGP